VPDHVPVDFELRGCPIDKGQLTALLTGRKPQIPAHSVVGIREVGHRMYVSIPRRQYRSPGPKVWDLRHLSL
jgi:coenzyme F420-reducing hydrogenase gamma subunit